MVTHTGAECFLFRISPEFVVETLESFGALRSQDTPVWYYPSLSKPQLYLTIMCQRRDESDRLGLGDTIGNHIMELIYERVQAWAEAMGRALGGDTAKGHAMIHRADVIVRAHIVDQAGTAPLRELLARLLEFSDAVVVIGSRAWTSADARDGQLNSMTLTF